MSDTTTTPEKPKTLSSPRRAFVKKNGKKLLKAVSIYQSRQSVVPDTPKIPNEYFEFLNYFTDAWEAIRDEAKEVLKYRDAIPGFEDVSPDQYRIAKEKQWKTFVLFGFGQKLEKNAKLAPRTCEILEKVPNLQTAWFSILAPGYHIPAHTGVTKGIVRAHLGLLIPEAYEKCRIRVDDTITAWKPGEIFVFDDTYEHEVWNDTDEERVILLFDFNRPMKLGGRILNKIMMSAMKMTAFYQDPKKNLQDAETRLEAAIRQNDANLEDLSN